MERARQDSNLRPSLFVVRLVMFTGVAGCLEKRLNKPISSL